MEQEQRDIDAKLVHLRSEISEISLCIEKAETIEESLQLVWKEVKLMKLENELAKKRFELSRISTKSWLKQVVPLTGPLQFDSVQRGEMDVEYDVEENLEYAPVSIKAWVGFEEEVLKTCDTIRDNTKHHPMDWNMFEMHGGYKKAVVRFICCNILLKVSAVRNDCKIAVDYSTLDIPDSTVMREDEACLPVEVNSFSTFRTSHAEPLPDLVEAYHGFRREGSYAPLANSTRQCVRYMAKAHVRYGILTNVDAWYFLRWEINEAEKSVSCLEISKGIAFDAKEPTLLQCLYHMFDRAIMERDMFTAFQFNLINEVIGRQPSEATQLQLHETRAADLHLKKVSSTIFGRVKGRKTLVKLAKRNSDFGKSLLMEVRAYHKLRKYWGQCVPTLVDFGTTAHGECIFMATEIVKRNPTGLELYNEAVAKAAREALQAVHVSGMVHGYLHEDSIWVTEGGVQLTDFEFAKFDPSEAECKKEFECLEKLIQKTKRRLT